MKNISEAKDALIHKPMFATSVERFMILDEIKSQYKDLPQPLRFAKFMSVLLERVSVPLESYDLIAGRCVDRELTAQEEERFQEFIHHPDYPNRSVLLSSGHCSYDWYMLVDKGLVGLKEDVARRLADETDSDKCIFLTAMGQIYDAIIGFLMRYSEAAKAKGMEELSSILRKAATEKPDSFRCALQLLWIVTFINCAYITENPTLTVGRLDQLLYPLYRSDLESGKLTKQDAENIIIDYFCKHNLIMGRGEHQVGDATNSTTFKRICNFDAPQYLLLAGTDQNGQPAVNDLTLMFARCIQPEFKNPVVVVRYFKDMNIQYPELWSTLTSKSLQSASLMFYNDDNVLRTFQRIGIPIEDAREYIHFGCNWPSLGTKSAWTQGGPSASKYGTFLDEEEPNKLKKLPMRVLDEHGWPETLLKVLNDLSDKEDLTIDDVYEEFFARMDKFIQEKLETFALDIRIRQRRPSSILSFTDCFLADSISTAECFSAGAKYHFTLQSFCMFGTTVDSIIAVDELVFREKKITLSELLEAVNANFEGYPKILAMCRNADKYGSDTPLSNAHVARLSEGASALVIKNNKPYLESMNFFLVPCMQSDTWHLKMGMDFGATPDGRLARTPFSQNIRPANGAAVNGLSAMLNSVLCLPNDGLLSGALNLDVSPTDFAGEEGHRTFAALLGSYFNRGGLHAQVSATDVEQLKEAQLHPYDHRDIRVRVTGYSGIFVDISKKLQDDIIERFE